MYTINQTDVFANWLSGLKDDKAAARIDFRMRMAGRGNLGDVKSVGDGVSEMRIDVGPGYRVYFTKRGKVVILLLCGGDKGTQSKDIKRAKQMVKDLGD